MRWHEPDDARVSSPESVRGSGCNSPGLLGVEQNTKGVVEALADLLLEALVVETKLGGVDEPQDHA